MPKISGNDEELKQGYIQFVAEIYKLKGEGWSFWRDSGARYKNDILFNVKETQEDGHYVLDDARVWRERRNTAKDFAKTCIKDCPTEDTEIFKVLFAYKMAYLCIMDFYSGERNLKEEEKNR